MAATQVFEPIAGPTETEGPGGTAAAEGWGRFGAVWKRFCVFFFVFFVANNFNDCFFWGFCSVFCCANEPY